MNIETTSGALLGGRIAFAQPARGYRAAIDPVLLAAAADAPAGGTAVDLGCGAGAALLCLAWRRPDLASVGVERDAGLAALAKKNVAANGWGGRVRIVAGDAAERGVVPLAAFDLAIVNPPYLSADAADPSPDPARRAANLEGDLDLSGWIAAALAALKPRGALVVVHRADRLDDLLAALRGKAGAAEIVPFWPRAGVAAKRIVVRARKGVRTRPSLAPGLALHESDGRYTPAAERLLRDGAALDEVLSSTGRGPGESSAG